MDNDTFHEDELTDEQKAILLAFEAADLKALAGKDAPSVALSQARLVPETAPEEDMRMIFIAEVAEDCETLQRVLQQETGSHAGRASGIQRLAHKLKGTCAAMNCTALSAIARHMEALAKQIENGDIAPAPGWQAMRRAYRALEMTLEDFAVSGQESREFLETFESECRQLSINLYAPTSAPRRLTAFAPLTIGEFARIDTRRSEELLRDAGQLAALSMSLLQAQAEVEQAFQELHAAEERLRRLEMRLTSHLTINAQRQAEQRESVEEYAASSLLARILSEAAQRTGRAAPRKITLQAQNAQLDISPPWDELEIDRFKEESVLALSISEAIADVSIAASQLRIAFAHLSRLLREQTTQAISVRDDALLLNLTPMGVLLKRIEQEVKAARPDVQYEATGEATEIEQDMLERLAPPLLQLIRTCLAASALNAPGGEAASERIWLSAQAPGGTLSIEVGFSMPVAGGALEEVEAAIESMHGSIEAARNATGGISFFLRLPRSRGTVHALVLRVQRHTFAVPLAHVQHVTQETPAQPVISLAGLLGLPTETAPGAESEQQSPPAYLILNMGKQETGTEPPTIVQVDAVVSEAALIVKQLPAPLRRPGITGSAIDGANNVLLLLDLPTLIERRPAASEAAGRQSDAALIPQAEPRPLTALVADDSVSIRQFLRHLLTSKGYEVITAIDGIEALELLRSRLPNVLILDVEMPNLNGYDLLSMMRSRPELAAVKIVMLTSRFSDKHQARASELGAHAYLTKPCDSELLLATLGRLLATS